MNWVGVLPAIDSAVIIPGINDSYVGAAPDIGAWEWTGSAAPGREGFAPLKFCVPKE